MELRLTCLILVGCVLSACGTASEPEPASPTFHSGTVVETTEGTVLCDGPVAESAPPQCEGPRLDSWEWSQAWSSHGSEGGRWGEFCFLGERDGEGGIAVIGDPRPAGTCDELEVTGVVSVIENSEGAVYVCLGPYDDLVPSSCPEDLGERLDHRLPIANWTWPEGADIIAIGAAQQAGFELRGVIAEGQFFLTREPEPLTRPDTPPGSRMGCGQFVDTLPEDAAPMADTVASSHVTVPELDIDPGLCVDVPRDSPVATAAAEAESHPEFLQSYLADGELVVWLRIEDPALLPALQRVAGADAVEVHASFVSIDPENS